MPVSPLIRLRLTADDGCMERRDYELAGVSVQPEADSAVAVAERGLESWRAAKAAWLDSFAAFAAEEALATSASAAARKRTR